MCGFMHIFQLLNRIVSVDLGRGQTGVAKQLFYRIHLGSVVTQMGGKTVPEYMGTFLADGSDQLKVFVGDPVDIFRIKLPPGGRNQEHLMVAFCQLIPLSRSIFPDLTKQVRLHRYDPLFIAFTQHLYAAI